MKTREAAFTLLEVMVSMLIFLVVSATMANAFMSHLKTNTATEVRTGAIAAAQLQLDEHRLADPFAMPTSGSTSDTKTVGGRDFTVITYYCQDPSFCISASTRHLLIKVRYANKQVFQTETVYTRLR
ncbi:MAG: type II secretion system protein [Deltaproteobacteria bacterium]|nr:type II secretion system protein [Deltaproteobacteria bacterium]